MLAAADFTELQGTQAFRSAALSGNTTVIYGSPNGLGGPGNGAFNDPSNVVSYFQGSAYSTNPRARWRASKGSAPVNRFTRSFGDNANEGWHRSMPVGIEVTAGTTATVAAMLILGASSTAEARATAATVGAFVLGVAAIAQAPASGPGFRSYYITG